MNFDYIGLFYNNYLYKKYLIEYEDVLKISWFNQETLPKKKIMFGHSVKFLEVGMAENVSVPSCNIFVKLVWMLAILIKVLLKSNRISHAQIVLFGKLLVSYDYEKVRFHIFM